MSGDKNRKMVRWIYKVPTPMNQSAHWIAFNPFWCCFSFDLLEFTETFIYRWIRNQIDR